jgi:hypothetical protein
MELKVENTFLFFEELKPGWIEKDGLIMHPDTDLTGFAHDVISMRQFGRSPYSIYICWKLLVVLDGLNTISLSL